MLADFYIHIKQLAFIPVCNCLILIHIHILGRWDVSKIRRWKFIIVQIQDAIFHAHRIEQIHLRKPDSCSEFLASGVQFQSLGFQLHEFRFHNYSVIQGKSGKLLHFGEIAVQGINQTLFLLK